MIVWNKDKGWIPLILLLKYNRRFHQCTGICVDDTDSCVLSPLFCVLYTDFCVKGTIFWMKCRRYFVMCTGFCVKSHERSSSGFFTLVLLPNGWKFQSPENPGWCFLRLFTWYWTWIENRTHIYQNILSRNLFSTSFCKHGNCTEAAE